MAQAVQQQHDRRAGRVAAGFVRRQRRVRGAHAPRAPRGRNGRVQHEGPRVPRFVVIAAVLFLSACYNAPDPGNVRRRRRPGGARRRARAVVRRAAHRRPHRLARAPPRTGRAGESVGDVVSAVPRRDAGAGALLARERSKVVVLGVDQGESVVGRAQRSRRSAA